MSLDQMIKELLDSGIIENQELGVSLLRTDQIDEETKRKLIDKFIDDYTSGRVNFFDEEHKHIFNGWVEVYTKNIKLEVKNRVKKLK